MYRHGLLATGAVELEWSQVDFTTSTPHVRQLKQGSPAKHPIAGDELRTLRTLHREGPLSCSYSERGTPPTTAAVRKIVARASDIAGFTVLGLPVHPHMLRHSTGYYLANKGHDIRLIQGYLVHRKIDYTVRYTILSADRFKWLWR